MGILLVLVSLAYLALLFVIARWGDRHGRNENSLARHPAIYALALGIYCTSWTYFGAVGAAAREGWSFIPIYLGPILLFVFGFPLIRKLVHVSKKHNITSVADFIASRYGKRQTVALLVTLLMTLAVIPYIALQLKAISTIFQTLVRSSETGTWTSSFETLLTSLLLAVFVILFGARKPDVTEYRSGLMLAIAAESCVKLLGLAVAAAIALWLLLGVEFSGTDWQRVTALWSPGNWPYFDFTVQTLMAAAAFLCLPRQFHVMVVDNAKPGDLETARWLAPLYLLAMAVFIVPIALIGAPMFSANGFDPDTLTMQLPLQIDSNTAVLLVFIGGLSATTAMIIVATLTLSTMWSNEVIMPLVLKRDVRQIVNQQQYHRRIITIRRISVGVILGLSFFYYQFLTQRIALHGIGLIAFSLVIQVLPAIVGGLYWRRGHASGVYGGLLAGFLCWLLFLLMPLAMSDGAEVSAIISRGVLISLSANAFAYWLFSIFGDERLLDKLQAAAFVQAKDVSESRGYAVINARVGDLRDLLTTFLGEERSHQIIEDYQQQQGDVVDLNARASEDIAAYCERQLAGVLGSASATSMINIALSGKRLDLEEVVNFFDDTTRALQTNQAILFNSLESLEQGISVVDSDLKLVAWNKAYLELFEYPEGLVITGRPIAELIRFNAERGECGEGQIEELVERRLRHMRSGRPHNFIRRRGDGRIVEMNGNPLPSGGFVTSFSDITRHIEAQKALQEANIDLEEHVKQQVDHISEISEALKSAKASAEQANASKTRFLALASHDILQPLNAARLYLSTLHESKLADDQQRLVGQVDQSLQATEDLIATLLEISRLEQGALQPSMSHFMLGDILRPLCDQYSLKAAEKSLRLRQHWRDTAVYCDRTWLRRIVQNLLSNAVKYTEEGSILISARVHRAGLLLQIRDTGVGIAEPDQTRVFDDFFRARSDLASGVGLGLAVVTRMSQQLQLSLKLNSNPGQGSCFSLSIPYGNTAKVVKSNTRETSAMDSLDLHVLCIDDNPDNLAALSTLLEKWQCRVDRCQSVAETIQYCESHPPPEILLVDYQLEPDASNGLELIEHLRKHWRVDLPACLQTAVKAESVKQACREQSVHYLAKPVKPARLKSWLKSIKSSL